MTDGLTLTGLLLSSHYSKTRCLQTVAVLALATPIGAIALSPFAANITPSLMGWWLGFIAGAFFYVGASDILPRIHKARDIYCLASFFGGILVGSIRFGH